MTALALGSFGFATIGLILCWSSWRFGATMPAAIWLRCLLASPVLTACTSLTEGWMHADFIPWWLGASMIGVREEGLKLLFVIVLANGDPDTRSPGDRLHAMTATALGFAVLEAISKAAPNGDMAHVLLQAYAGFYMGTALHVFLSLQAAAFLILGRTRSRLWLTGIAIPMALHSIWDSPYLVGITAPDAMILLRSVVMAAIVILAIALAWLAVARPGVGASRRWSGAAALISLLALTTVLQIAGRAGWHHGITVTPYVPLGLHQLLIAADFAPLMRPYAAAAKTSGDKVDVLEPTDANHFDIVTPVTRNGTAVADFIAAKALTTPRP